MQGRIGFKTYGVKIMRVFALVLALFVLSISLIGCLDTIFGDDDDDNDADAIPEPVERETHKEYHPFEVIYEHLSSGWEDSDAGKLYEHSLSFHVRNISDIGICKAECRVWAVTKDGSVINAMDEEHYLETEGPLHPGEIWGENYDASVRFDYDKHEFSDLKDAEIHYSFTWEKCKADVDYISVLEADVDGTPTAHVTIKNTGGVPVHNVTAEVTVWHARVSETMGSDLVVFKDGGTLMPGETAEATAVFEDKAAGFGGVDHFIRVDIRFEEGSSPEADQ
jgi:hypothetical protein